MTETRIADHDWLSAPTDTPANARWEGCIDPAGITLVAQLGFWPWDSQAMQAMAASVSLLDADGLLDAEALADISGQAVEIRQAAVGGTLDGSVPVARFVVDKLTIETDGRKTLSMRDAHDDLDKAINAGVFADDVVGLAGQPQPMSIGAVFNAPVLLTGSDGSVGWLADAPQAVAVLRDRADPMETGTWSLDSYQQQVLLNSPPLGPMTVDQSSVSVVAGQPTPATLQQALREVMRRAGITAWSSADATAIDTACGYSGIGMYAGQPITARTALAAICATYSAWYWQDSTGVLRLTRLVDPAGITASFSLDGSDITEDLTFTTDLAPNLSTKMAWRPVIRVMSDTEFVSDLVDVPHEMRAILKSKQYGIVTATNAASLADEYRHALDANPFPSLFWAEANAQTEIDRICGLYASVRRNYAVKFRDTTLVPVPGQCCQLTYPRYGLESGKKLLVRRVERNPATGECSLILWG